MLVASGVDRNLKKDNLHEFSINKYYKLSIYEKTRHRLCLKVNDNWNQYLANNGDQCLRSEQFVGCHRAPCMSTTARWKLKNDCNLKRMDGYDKM